MTQTWTIPRSETSRFYKRLGKRTLDLSLALLGALLIAPFLLPLVCLYGLYSQDRVGQDGKRFRIWKLRTMIRDADQILQAQLKSDPEFRSIWEQCPKMANDPRITKMGRWLRKASIDELPQLWNVIRGDMSLVGPRPFLPEQEQYYPGDAYYRMKPGITGFWQLTERNSPSLVVRSYHDTEYERNMCLGMDLFLILMTVAEVFRGSGK
ncbi:MAG: sugar transferase [Anaerolineaceae bacterium]